MKKQAIFMMVAYLATIQSSWAGTRLTSEYEQTSYSLGVNIGKSFKDQMVEVDHQAFAAGIKDSLAGDELKIPETKREELLSQFQQKLIKKHQARTEKLKKENLALSTAFLEKNKQQPGVLTLNSGLQYKVLKSGSKAGKSPTLDDEVVVHYRGTLVDGNEFDSSIKRGEPVTLKVRNVIAGWTEALQQMKTGDKWQIVLPPALGYGQRGSGPLIGPNMALIFEVELLSIVEKKSEQN